MNSFKMMYCKRCSGYIQSNLHAKFEDNINYINSQINLPNGVSASQNNSAMDLSKMLNQPNAPLSLYRSFHPLNPPASQEQGSSESTGLVCHGLNGTTAPGHSQQINKGCSVLLCCCLNLNNNTIPCSKHKHDNKVKHSNNNNNPKEQPNYKVTPVGNSHSMGNYSTSTQPSLPQTSKKFAQAEDCKRSEHDQKSNHMDNPFGYWAGRFHAPHWPTFALSYLDDVKRLVGQHLGEDWQGDLQVWNADEQLWSMEDKEL
ncbi:uncharacterized protein MELLADRAFT_65052 [Melampsora larici-populina 98AG31]|uniref:Uncharacterized protein n=1 Tax=Melampsora larici-populina (strain 98AG31 / pathotype 3-4-7) TaxID=747676 RepID=F4RTT3_MELLP|nr:uncharacterized protein MELLADRAFT_65052 [Melampsora larici-populina 98AG31]EGG04203.1 hypothetical protein MELLADRAFT_65052 [Melampsora larici-populina 98AG31]